MVTSHTTEAGTAGSAGNQVDAGEQSSVGAPGGLALMAHRGGLGQFMPNFLPRDCPSKWMKLLPLRKNVVLLVHCRAGGDKTFHRVKRGGTKPRTSTALSPPGVSRTPGAQRTRAWAAHLILHHKRCRQRGSWAAPLGAPSRHTSPSGLFQPVPSLPILDRDGQPAYVSFPN